MNAVLVSNYLSENDNIRKREILLSITEDYLQNKEYYLAFLCACKLFVDDDSYGDWFDLCAKLDSKSIVTDSSCILLDDKHAVSVIIPTFNRPKELLVSLESVLRQQFTDYEVIVINDCGTDEAEEVVRSFSCEKIKYFKLPLNKGLSAARNEGILRASGKYIAYLDDDDIFYDHHLSTVAGFLINNPSVDVAYADAWYCYGHLVDGIFRERRREALSERPLSFNKERLFRGNYISTLNIVHKKECFSKTGLFNENLPKLEDWDFLLRLACNFSIVQLNEKTGEYRWKGNNMSVIAKQEMELMYLLLKSYYETDSAKFMLACYYKNNGQTIEYDAMSESISIEQQKFYKTNATYNLLISMMNNHNSYKFRDMIRQYFERDAINCLKKLLLRGHYFEAIRLLLFRKHGNKRIICQASTI